MINLQKIGKVYYKAENGELVGGSFLSCPTQAVADTFKEFDNIDQAYEFFGVENAKEVNNE